MSSIVKMADHPRVCVRPIGMAADAYALDDGINLDRVDTADAVAQRMGDVITGPRADDEHILEWRTAGDSFELVNQRILRPGGVERHHLLMPAIVDEDATTDRVVFDRVI